MKVERLISTERDRVARRTIEILVESGAFRTGEFTLNSGILAPMKIDTDSLREYIALHREVSQYLADLIRQRGKYPSVIVGVITGGVSFAREAAEILGIRWAARLGNTRSASKSAMVEGELVRGDRALILEDVITTGGNVVACSRHVKGEGVAVVDAVSIFTYDTSSAWTNLHQGGLSCDRSNSLADVVDLRAQLLKEFKQGRAGEEETGRILDWMASLK